jgi:hypothetical protein
MPVKPSFIESIHEFPDDRGTSYATSLGSYTIHGDAAEFQGRIIHHALSDMDGDEIHSFSINEFLAIVEYHRAMNQWCSSKRR